MSGSIGGIGGNMMSMQELWDQKFNTIDTNKDGEIDSDELTSVLSQSESGGSGFSASVSEIMDTLDIDGSGTISKEENQAGMSAMMQAYGPPPPPPQTQETSSTDGSESESDSTSSIFAAADTNEDGYVSLEELTAAMEDVPQGVEGVPDAEEIFAQVDTDGDGLISETEDAEWVARMAQGPPPPPPAVEEDDASETVAASTSATEETSTATTEAEDSLYEALLEVLNDEKQAAALARVFTTAIETYAKNLGSGASGADGTQAASVSAVC